MRRSIGTIVKALLALAVLAYLVYFVEPAEIAAAAAKADVRWLLAALALLPANLVTEGTAWYLMLRHVVPGVTPAAAAGSFMAGHALALFTPARAGMYVGRALYLKSGNRWDIGAMAVAQSLFNLVAAAGSGSALLLFALHRGLLPRDPVWIGIAAIGAALTLLLLALLLRPRDAHRAISRLIRSPRITARIEFLRRLEGRQSALFLIISVVHYLIYTSQLLLLVAAFDPPVPLGTVYAGIGVVFLVKNMLPPVTLTDLGIREGAAVLVLGQLGVSGAAALSAALLLYGINLILPAILGIPFVLRLRMGPRRPVGVGVETAPE